ncbi:MAG: SDR family NAD(P)-dependent oxidoreductase [Nitratireductor sp.]
MNEHKKTALVTGGTLGLGQGFVQNLLEQGYEVVSIDRDLARDLAKGSLPKNLHQIQCDLSNQKSVDALSKKLQKFAPFHLAIFNAGISATGKFEEMPIAAYQTLLRLNAETPMVLTSALLENNLLAPKSNLLFVSSLSHFTGYPGAAVYAASKDAIAIYAKSIKKSFAKKGITVSCAFPGPLKTQHAKRHSPKGSSDEKRMAPKTAASLILQGVQKGRHQIFTGFGMFAVSKLGKLFPNMLSFIMRKTLYDKMDKNVF